MVGNASVDTDGNFTILGSTDVSIPGNYSFTLRQTLVGSGTTSTVDSGSIDTPAKALVGTTELVDGHAFINGTAHPGANVTVIDANGTVVGYATADGSGAWSLNSTDYSWGSFTFTASQTVGLLPE